MASNLVTTVSGSTSNSYVTLQEAASYFDDRIESQDWESAAENDRIGSLIMAARRLNEEDYHGAITDIDQLLAWPRAGLSDREDRFIDDDIIPEFVKRAQMELALKLLGGGLEGFEDVASLSVGPLSITPRHAKKADDLPDAVMRELRLFLRTGRSEIKLERA